MLALSEILKSPQSTVFRLVNFFMSTENGFILKTGYIEKVMEVYGFAAFKN